MIKKHKKLLIRIGSILACVFLVAGLALPAFAADEPTEEQPIDVILAQAAELNQLYSNFYVDVSSIVPLLSQGGRNYTNVISYTEIDDRMFSLPFGNVFDFLLNTDMKEYYGRLTLQIIGDAVDPLYTFDEDMFAVSITQFENGTDFGFFYNIYTLQPDDSLDVECILVYRYYPLSETAGNLELLGVILDDVQYDVMSYSITGSFVQFEDNPYYVYGLAPMLGVSVYPSRDLQLNIPEGGGATEEELQDAYDNGFTAGQTEGYNNGFEAAAQRDFGGDILGEAFSKPMEMLRDFTIVSLPNGIDITLGHVASALIAMLLVIAFLKIYAGG